MCLLIIDAVIYGRSSAWKTAQLFFLLAVHHLIQRGLQHFLCQMKSQRHSILCGSFTPPCHVTAVKVALRVQELPNHGEVRVCGKCCDAGGSKNCWTNRSDALETTTLQKHASERCCVMMGRVCVCGRHGKIADIVCRLKMAFIPITRLSCRRCPADESFIAMSACERRAPAACVWLWANTNTRGPAKNISHTLCSKHHQRHTAVASLWLWFTRVLQLPVGTEKCCGANPDWIMETDHTEHVCFRVESHIKRSIFTLVWSDLGYKSTFSNTVESFYAIAGPIGINCFSL